MFCIDLLDKLLQCGSAQHNTSSPSFSLETGMLSVETSFLAFGFGYDWCH